MRYLYLAILLFCTTIAYSQYQIPVNLNDVKADSCICYNQIKELVPDKCNEVKISYNTLARESVKYFTRCELLTYMPKSRPNGWAAYKLSATETYGGYWVTGYGWFDSLVEADEMAEIIKKDYPEFCKCYGTPVPSWTMRLKYESTTIPEIGK